MTLAASSSSGRPWLSKDVCRGGHQVQGIIWMAENFLVCLWHSSLSSLASWLSWALTSLQRPTSGRKLTRAAINLELRAETRRRRPATRQRRASLAPWLTSTFTCAPGVRPQNARQSAARETTRGRAPAQRCGAHARRVAAGEPSRRPRRSPDRRQPPLREAVAARESDRTTTLTRPTPRRNPRMPSSARTSSRPSATRKERSKSCMTSSRRRSRGPGSRSSSPLC